MNLKWLFPFKYIRKKALMHAGKWLSFGKVSSRFIPHMSKESGKLLLAFSATVGYVCFGILEPWPLKMIFDNVFLNEPLPPFLIHLSPFFSDNKLLMLYILIGCIVGIALIKSMFNYYQQLLASGAVQQIVSGIRLDLYKHLQRLSFSFHDNRKTGDMISRLTTDIRILRNILITLPLMAITDLLLMTSMVCVMAVIDWRLTMMALMVIPIHLLLIKKYRLPMKTAMRNQREREGHLSDIATEVLGAIKLVQGFHRQSYEVGKFGAQNKNSLNTGLKATRLEAKLNWASELSVAVVAAIILGVAGRSVLKGTISPGELLIFAYYLRTFNRPLRRISRLTEQLSRAAASGGRILDIMEIEPAIAEKPGAAAAPKFKGEIRFKNVCFEYKKGRQVLEDINLLIGAGEKVCFSGPSGSGKSTLAGLIPRFYDCQSGGIFIDGINIREWTLKSLRRQISIIFQEPVLFAATVAENIAYGKPGTGEEEIIKAAQKAHISEIIESLPKGYQTIIGERGANLSGGQRQCVAIARSMIKNAPIVILDEPTAGLDMASALLVLNALKELTREKTVIWISHDREIIHSMDRVVKIKKGRIESIKSPKKINIQALTH